MDKETLIRNIDIFLAGDYLQMKCNLNNVKNLKKYSFCYYVYKTGELESVSKSRYIKFNNNQVLLKSGGNYWVKVFVKNNETNEIITRISKTIQKTKIIDI